MKPFNATPSLFNEFFQFGYVTRNLGKSLPPFEQRFGNAEFLIFPVPLPADGQPVGATRIALTYVKDLMIEIIEVDPAVPSIYVGALPSSETDIALHHFGYLVDDFAGTLARLAEHGYDVPVSGSSASFMDYAYADTRSQFGHYLEFVRLGDGGRQLFDAVPR